MKRGDTARRLAARWNLSVQHALYRETGDWYHQLKRFPGALLDATGFLVFETEMAYRACPELRFRKGTTGVPSGIVNVPGYVWARDIAPLMTYERAKEGRAIEVLQTRYERDPQLRTACLAHFGYSCTVCGLTFEVRYGALGAKFIHVHHLRPLADGEHPVDPLVDLRPVCPNCHAMLHRQTPPLSPDELRALLQQIADCE